MDDIKIKSIDEDNAMRNNFRKDSGNKLEEYLSDANQDKANPVFIQTEDQYKPKGLMRLINHAGKMLMIFLLGGLGGVWFEHSVLPVISTREPFESYSFFKAIKERTVIINRTEEIKITEDNNRLDMIRKTSPAIVSIAANYVFQEKPPAKKKANAPPLKTKIETRNLSGTIITSDGLVLTRDPKNFSADLLKSYNLQETSYIVKYKENEYTITGSQNIVFFGTAGKFGEGDLRNNIAILKMKASNLPVAVLGDSSNLEAGTAAVALGNNLFSGMISEIKKQSYGEGDSKSEVKIIMMDKSAPPGYFGSGPVVDFSGKLLGINIIDLGGVATGNFIAIENFRSFINEVIGG